MIITIDGPVASGKSTIARMLAHERGYYYLNSGLLYRALGYVLLTDRGYTIENISDVSQKDIDYSLDAARFLYCYDEENRERVFFDDTNITPYLKDRSIDKVASIISVNMYVRHAITKLQHSIAAQHNIVIDGRDVGSVVFPYAECKLYVTASIEVRACRWQKDQEKYGNHVSREEAIVAITDRDERDKNRSIAPLIIPDGAVVIDTSDADIEQVIKKVLHSIKNCF